jgi:C-terminal processing protease CtpA/Prc
MLSLKKSFALMTLALASAPLNAATPEQYRSDARGIVTLIQDNYAYPERLPGQEFALTERLKTEMANVHDADTLLAFAERALMLLEDHHAITGSSFDDSWGIVPSFADLWIERQGGAYKITAVREGSFSAKAGVKIGDTLTAVSKITINEAVAAFWSDLGRTGTLTDQEAGFAARILAAGRRDRFRALTIAASNGQTKDHALPSLYTVPFNPNPVTASEANGHLTIKINDSLGNETTVGAFDLAMTGLRAGLPVIIDLTNTPSGGNTVVARAIMGWFVTQPRFYQIHRSPGEERRTGIGRQWIEQVLPRSGGRYHAGPVTVRVSRWTGSMGEGLAIGMNALGARVEGGKMAQLLGAIEDFKLPNSGLVIKFPTEKLFGVDGTPREDFVGAD